MKDPVPDLLKLAGIPSSDNAAAAWLSDAMRFVAHGRSAICPRYRRTMLELLADAACCLIDWRSGRFIIAVGREPDEGAEKVL
jgi:hypothetical protein